MICFWLKKNNTLKEILIITYKREKNIIAVDTKVTTILNKMTKK